MDCFTFDDSCIGIILFVINKLIFKYVDIPYIKEFRVGGMVANFRYGGGGLSK